MNEKELWCQGCGATVRVREDEYQVMCFDGMHMAMRRVPALPRLYGQSNTVNVRYPQPCAACAAPSAVLYHTCGKTTVNV